MNLSEPKELALVLEAFLLASGKPQSLERLMELFEEGERPEPAVFKKALTVLAKSCEGRALELKEVASGYRLQVRERYAPWVGRLWEERPQRYSRALLETLALVAYRQPITRGEIEEIRGVSVSTHITKTLLEREWIRVVGHRDVPGRPAMYGTTRAFLDYFNLKNLDELPSLAEIRDLDKISAELDARGQDLLPPVASGDEDEGTADEAAASANVAETLANEVGFAEEAMADTGTDEVVQVAGQADAADFAVTDVEVDDHADALRQEH